MTARKYYDKQVIRIGLIFGLIGGGLMIYLGFADFGLYYLQGYLFLINYFLIIITGLAFYKENAKDKSTYIKRFITGLFIYVLSTLCFFINSVIFGKLSNERTFEDKVFVPLIFLALGLILSSLLALLFKPNKIGNSDKKLNQKAFGKSIKYDN